MNRDALLERLRTSWEEMAAQFDASEEELGKTYAPGKWTVAEILAHVADTEMVYLFRFMKAVSEPGSRVESFDQDRFAEALRYKERPLAHSRWLFVVTRDLFRHHVRACTEAQLAQVVLHLEQGEMSAAQFAEYAITHCLHHAGQIRAARAGVLWKPKA